MNELELALSGDSDRISFYLGDVTVSDFIKHIDEIKAKYANQGAIDEAIKLLQGLKDAS